MAWLSSLSHLECSACRLTYDADTPMNLCKCGSPLLARYDLAAAARSVSPSQISRRAPTLWRYRELLPVRSSENVVSLGEGMTPLLPSPRLGTDMGVPRLMIKDEGLLPTGSFKARGAAVGVARAKELGIRRVAMPTNGNAGGAWATYGARAGIGTLIAMPRDAPRVPRVECALAGARLYLVDGLIGDAGKLVAAAVARGDYFDAATLKEPYRLEGKKTMGLELVEQLGWNVPDVIVYPTGGGVGLIGIDKALQELRELGWLPDGKGPRLVSVQASGCAPIVRAFEEGAAASVPWVDGQTVAFGINVGKALGDFLVLDAVRRSEGTAIAVADDAITEMQRRCYELDGLFVCPEGAAALAAIKQLRAAEWIAPNETVVALNTGNGIKYADQHVVDAPVLNPDGEIPS